MPPERSRVTVRDRRRCGSSSRPSASCWSRRIYGPRSCPWHRWSPTSRHSTGFSSGTAGLLTTLPILFFGLRRPTFAPWLAARFGFERAVFGSMVADRRHHAARDPGTPWLFAGSAVVGAPSVYAM